ncbi:RNA-guided pseudouridylation complex pseudouridine synthase subunit Cbf5 [Candidatus Pacearchaeota archaeon]|nr:RNA-guided pseudouridylation complex pseudouridine synthase subunit Cbf5 [Candidatus Pacearchaeota archaeon]
MKINIEKIKSQKDIKELLEFGIINIDKPSGPTSFDISDFVRKKLQLRKTSHFGTLDPQVTGVLPIALNRACKLTGFFLGEDKEYVGIMRIHEEISVKDLQEMINKKFLGKIKQLPPVKSRVARVLREREVKVFEILEQDEDKKGFLFKTGVQGGTYIRKLVHDLGEALGFGAHMLELRRIRAGIFKEHGKEYPSVNLYDFENAVGEFVKGNEQPLRKMIIPGEVISELYPVVLVKNEFTDRILRGSPIYHEYIESAKDKNIEMDRKFCAFSKDIFLGIYKVVSEGKIFAKPEFVLQPIGKN